LLSQPLDVGIAHADGREVLLPVFNDLRHPADLGFGFTAIKPELVVLRQRIGRKRGLKAPLPRRLSSSTMR